MKIMRKTKIICTVGPASDSEAVLKKMIKSGMNVARLNFSHGSHEEHQLRIDRIKALRESLGIPVAIMLDTKGPEYRIGCFENGSAYISDGDDFTFSSRPISGSEKAVGVSDKVIIKELNPGDIILVNDGLVKFKVVSKSETELFCKTLIGGRLSDRKSMSFPGRVFTKKYLSNQDKADLLFGIKNDIDFVACSFVSNAQDIKDVRRFLDKNGGEDIQLIAKIENQSGVDNAEDILKHCEGLMVARGDLGVEVPYAQLPAIQKHLIKLCRREGGISIIATEMLESMTANPRPTRAEISDVANAVYDGGSVVMLSGETASGKYPLEALCAMDEIIVESEGSIAYRNRFRTGGFDFANITDSLSHAACQLAIDANAKCIVACTSSGQTARMISRFRVPMPIIGLTPSDKALRQLCLSWNVVPVKSEAADSSDELFRKAREAAISSGLAGKGDTIVTTGGMTNRKNQTSLIHAEIL